jgi:cobalamin biosynthesis protein CobD/CbiB
MKRYFTLAELIERQQRQQRMAQRIAGIMACVGLLLTATMVAGWLLTW